MTFAKFLRQKHETTVALFESHRESVLHLQEVLLNVILPAAAEEFALDESSLDRAKEWIDDKGSIFRMLKKHNFRIVEAQAALQQTLHWRMSVMVPSQTSTAAQEMGLGLESFIACLPPHATDMAGRPVIRMKLAGLPEFSEGTRLEILRVYDVMRVRLRQARSCQVLQYLLMVDFKDANVRNMAVELITWFIREVAPRFPGMCAGVFVLNYSWTYSGIYNLVKHLLPSTVLERISFPTQVELLSHFERRHLPREYGGELDLSTPPVVDLLTRPDAPLHAESRHVPKNTNLAAFLPAMSLLNPFYGYPAVSNQGSSTPQLKNGRRRKRDLAKTLVLLWLAKLKRTADKTWLWIIMTIILWLVGMRSRRQSTRISKDTFGNVYS